MRTIIKISVLVLALTCSVSCGSRDAAHPRGLIVLGNSGGVYTLAAGNNNDFYTGAATLVLAAHASGSTITGIDTTAIAGDQDTFLVRNQGSLPIPFTHEDAGSAAANRIHTRSGTAITLLPGHEFWITWDTTMQRWLPYQDPAIWGVESTSTPAHAIGDVIGPFTRPTAVYYSVSIESAAVLTGGERGRVELRCDTANPPTTVRARVRGGVTAPLIGLTTTSWTEAELHYLMPVGFRCRMVSVDEIGTPIYAITAQQEDTL